MADSGFDEILEESGLYNRNHINGILSGKHSKYCKQFSRALYTCSTGILLSAGSKMRAIKIVSAQKDTQ